MGHDEVLERHRRKKVPTTPLTVHWLNQSQGDLDDADAAKIVTALNAQVAELAVAWPHITTTSVTHVLQSDPTAVPPDGWPMYWLPSADIAGVLGYHDVDPHGRAYGRVFTRNPQTNKPWPSLTGANSTDITISSISSHEAVEIAVDPACTATATAPNGDSWALESADPVEAFSYVLDASGTPVSVSDFVTAAFFGMGTGPVDHLGAITTPFTIAPGGYAIINGNAVYGETYPGWRLHTKEFPAARTYRRQHQ